MALDFEQRVEVRRTPAECFAFVDDFANAPRWNRLCVALERVDPASRAVGGALVYTYKEGQGSRVMKGVVAEREPGKRLLLKLQDKLAALEVGFRFDAIPGGTRIEHTLRMEPRSFLGRLLLPLARGAVAKHVTGEAQALAKLLDG